MFRRRFTPRRRASPWSERDIGPVATLTTEGRMRPAGIREVERAQADGRGERAYAGQASAAEPEDLLAALAASLVAMLERGESPHPQ
ncbi:hypothetical protein BFL36_12925 [Clavibacter michiganensis]|uniref:Uncharacterized protein n=1 Tax=Clavibacter michiganensis TaxID=28447 RepID=A0A251Y4F5_9MICO|nr:hypothetical protein [Clavibacter michiganensis]OUE18939.1 hypothetical protein BFL36_12925 [Clavibacter michiganensis]